MKKVIAAATVQLLTVVPFLLGTFVVLTYGAGAERAAEAEVVRQGFPAGILAENGVSFGGSEGLAIVLALILVVLALLNLAGKRIGPILSWIFQPVLLVMGVVIIPSQLFTEKLLAQVPAFARLDVHALVEAASGVMPGWLPYATVAKLVLTTAGSVAVIVLLALPSSRREFHTP
ncbi:hypothetical protein ACIBHX_36375 [Nonomuraea sp. NPDC050536]|uniref:hypothetical protein n=1 Tax=Nonomuraea sp. NPDC050536 TaxID=3364366 RepID=UPI0037CBD8A9